MWRIIIRWISWAQKQTFLSLVMETTKVKGIPVVGGRSASAGKCRNTIHSKRIIVLPVSTHTKSGAKLKDISWMPDVRIAYVCTPIILIIS